MIKADFHMHTSFSSDSETMPEKMVEEAIRMGLKTICFTDHQDFDFPGEETLFLFDTDTYFRKMKKLREMYQDKIDIRIGVEIGLQPHFGNAYKEYVSSYPFDFVIGSVHVVNRMDPYYGEFFEDKTDAEAYRQAFLETRTFGQLKILMYWDTLTILSDTEKKKKNIILIQNFRMKLTKF